MVALSFTRIFLNVVSSGTFFYGLQKFFQLLTLAFSATFLYQRWTLQYDFHWWAGLFWRRDILSFLLVFSLRLFSLLIHHMFLSWIFYFGQLEVESLGGVQHRYYHLQTMFAFYSKPTVSLFTEGGGQYPLGTLLAILPIQWPCILSAKVPSNLGLGSFN